MVSIPLEVAMLLLVAGTILAYGIFCFGWPAKARHMFISQYDMTGPLKWYNPSTWLRTNITAGVFRIIGVLFIALGALLFWQWARYMR